MELSPEQVLIVGIVSSVLVVIVKLIAARLGRKLSKAVLTSAVAVVSFILAVAFQVPQLPVFADIFQFIGEWLTLLSAYVGFATLIYNLIIDKVLDAAGWTTERFYKPQY